MASSEAVSPPNIVLCLCDQLRAFETGCYGHPVVRTPHIDRRASRGVRFATAVTNNPVCMAARTALLSGQYSRTCKGHMANDEADTGGKGWGGIEPEWPERQRGAHLPNAALPELLRGAGYQTAAIGKWHIRPAPECVGFDRSVLPLTNHRHTGQQFRIDGGAPTAIEGFSAEREIEQVEAFLARRADAADPFFLYYNIMPPHMPLGDMPEHYLGMYAPSEVVLRPNVAREGQLPASDEWFKVYLWDYAYYHHREPHTLELPEGFDLRALTALYYGSVAWVDELVGRLMRALKANGLADNTIVVFTSDHGDNLGSHQRWNKGVLLEEAIRIPMLWHCPDRWASGVNSDQVASLIDIMPTLLDACGLDVPDAVQGQSLLPLLAGQQSALARDWAFIETSGSSAGNSLREIGIRTPSHLYGMALDRANGALVEPDYCFYDLQRDPFELDNLIGTDRGSEIAAQLKQRLLDWHRDTPWLDDPDCGPDRSHLFDGDGLPR